MVYEDKRKIILIEIYSVNLIKNICINRICAIIVSFTSSSGSGSNTSNPSKGFVFLFPRKSAASRPSSQ